LKAKSLRTIGVPLRCLFASPQFIALLGFATPRFSLFLKPEPLPWLYVTVMLGRTLVLEALPVLEELVPGLRYGTSTLNPPRGRPALGTANIAARWI
jgi:hypothetical protein